MATDDELEPTGTLPYAGLAPQTLFGASVGIALVISAQAWLGVARGSQDPLSAGIRFLVGVAVVWACLWVLNSMVGTFIMQADAKAAAIEKEAASERRAAEAQAALEAAAAEANALEQPSV